ncbi:CYCLIN-DEPENDENT PROTEIN KINASE INHIBITOR SMR14 [Salix koriyanagi]|uniref:CYCLIN-DEPENDENT PROTEIN KINASE INHIBITOR SMR14 n=1 Tax=Salix koriyanagi TaxID=2511006 RepID=A0A9Q1ADR3_9ROSI|nr:CYCLIN-DEPENDENT PROTEIN KINASE INHIBITOR SMR14 [Salix koriyanagi]
MNKKETMSTDLELRRDLPAIQVRAVKTETLQSCRATDDKETIIQRADSETDDDCQTPKSEEHKIPPVLCCPPAPRKPRRSFSCKRKLAEFEFFETVNREEVDSFFQSSFELLPKRRCPCI